MFDLFTPYFFYTWLTAPVTWLTAPVTWLTAPAMCHLLGTFVTGRIRLLDLTFVPRLVGGRHRLSVAILFIHGRVAGCQHCLSPSSNDLDNYMIDRSNVVPGSCKPVSVLLRGFRRPRLKLNVQVKVHKTYDKSTKITHKCSVDKPWLSTNRVAQQIDSLRY